MNFTGRAFRNLILGLVAIGFFAPFPRSVANCQMLPSTSTGENQGQPALRLAVLDGERTPIAAVFLWVRIFDHHGALVFRGRVFVEKDGQVSIPISPHWCAPLKILVTAKGYRSGWLRYRPENTRSESRTVTLVARHSEFTFLYPEVNSFRPEQPDLYALLMGGKSDEEAQQRYAGWVEKEQAPLAALLNISQALSELPCGSFLLYYRQIKEIRRDRFFAYADPALLTSVQTAAAQGWFVRQTSFDLLLHPGGTLSYKEIDLPEANLQITFHQKNTIYVDGKQLVLVETDIDYFKQFWKHSILEVVHNLFFHRKTNPQTVYRMRSNERSPEEPKPFSPPYLLGRKGT